MCSGGLGRWFWCSNEASNRPQFEGIQQQANGPQVQPHWRFSWEQQQRNVYLFIHKLQWRYDVVLLHLRLSAIEYPPSKNPEGRPGMSTVTLPVWNLWVVIWFPFPISCLVFSAESFMWYWSILQTFLRNVLHFSLSKVWWNVQLAAIWLWYVHIYINAFINFKKVCFCAFLFCIFL